MAMRFIRKVRTASGAVAVQIVNRTGRTVTGIEHIGFAHTDAELGVLLAKAERELLPGQQAFDLGDLEQLPVRTSDIADWRELERPAESSMVTPRSVTAAGKVIASPAIILWEVLDAAYDRLGFNILADAAFKAMVLARLIEPASKADTIRILDRISTPHPSLRTLFRSLGACIEKDYRDQLSKAMVADGGML